MSTIDDSYDSDDPLAPKIERLTPITIPKYREETPPVTKSSNRKKVGPSQGDTVLLGYLNPNRPDLAVEGGNLVLLRDSPPNSESRSKEREERDEQDEQDEQDVEEDLDERLAKQMMKEEKEREEAVLEQKRGTLDPPPQEHETTEKERAMTASKNLNLKLDQDKPACELPSNDVDMSAEKPFREQSKIKHHKDQLLPGPLNTKGINQAWRQSTSTTFLPPHTSIPSKQFNLKKEPHRRHSINSFSERPNGSPDSPLAHSPLRTLLRDAPTDGHRLAPMQSASSPPSLPGFTSPVLNQQLPPVGPILKVADETNSETQLRTRQRQQSMSSISAITAPSPTYTMSSGPSPATYGSPPTSLDSATSPRDWASKPPGSAATSPFYTQFNTSYRRASQASETFPPLHSATSDSYNTSSDAFGIDTPGTVITTPSETSGRIGETRNVNMGPPTPLSMTMPNAASTPVSLSASTPGAGVGGGTGLGMTNGATLPPLGHQAINAVPTHGIGTFKCDYPNCNAAPFHTQYLLNSHATVHSSNRPHYCPVQGCSRSINGQGFKRKNEMIRHQLVHESPGYVCPFCPEREHKYPRPDNLQRHVRVHHADVQPGDLRLRQVLERKASGRGSGRRRKGVPY